MSILKIASVALSSIMLAAVLSGCLTADKKEVHINLNPDGKSGSGTILFTGISSSPGDSDEVIKEDFSTLIAQYYQGRKIEMDNKGMKNVHKRLFKKDGKLMGEITFDFDDVSSLGFFRYKNSGPYMFYTVAEGFFTSGQYEASNGSYLGEKMPVIFWDPQTAISDGLYYTMSLSTPQEPRKSLVPEFDRWQSKQR
ncbi:MAG TPA: hypothetical protein VG537_07350 [Candidatus Kapabacteria bacterium]|nr:hypothetical protein [Candidatus Kapabacteria bacterium]